MVLYVPSCIYVLFQPIFRHHFNRFNRTLIYITILKLYILSFPRKENLISKFKIFSNFMGHNSSLTV